MQDPISPNSAPNNPPANGVAVPDPRLIWTRAGGMHAATPQAADSAARPVPPAPTNTAEPVTDAGIHSVTESPKQTMHDTFQLNPLKDMPNRPVAPVAASQVAATPVQQGATTDPSATMPDIAASSTDLPLAEPATAAQGDEPSFTAYAKTADRINGRWIDPAQQASQYRRFFWDEDSVNQAASNANHDILPAVPTTNQVDNQAIEQTAAQRSADEAQEAETVSLNAEPAQPAKPKKRFSDLLKPKLFKTGHKSKPAQPTTTAAPIPAVPPAPVPASEQVKPAAFAAGPLPEPVTNPPQQPWAASPVDTPPATPPALPDVPAMPMNAIEQPAVASPVQLADDSGEPSPDTSLQPQTMPMPSEPPASTSEQLQPANDASSTEATQPAPAVDSVSSAAPPAFTPPMSAADIADLAPSAEQLQRSVDQTASQTVAATPEAAPEKTADSNPITPSGQSRDLPAPSTDAPAVPPPFTTPAQPDEPSMSSQPEPPAVPAQPLSKQAAAAVWLQPFQKKTVPKAEMTTKPSADQPAPAVADTPQPASARPTTTPSDEPVNTTDPTPTSPSQSAISRAADSAELTASPPAVSPFAGLPTPPSSTALERAQRPPLADVAPNNRLDSLAADTATATATAQPALQADLALGLADLRRLAKVIRVGGVRLNEVFAAKRLSQTGLERVIATFMNGGDIAKVLTDELIRTEQLTAASATFSKRRGGTKPSTSFRDRRSGLAQRSAELWHQLRTLVIRLAKAIKRETGAVYADLQKKPATRRKVEAGVIILIWAAIILLIATRN